MSLLDTINSDLTAAMKARNPTVVSSLRMVLSNLKTAAIAKGADLEDDEIVSEISRVAKRHKESIQAFENAGRAELVEKEKKELAVVSKYLPEQMSDEEVSRIVDEVIAQTGAATIADLGRVMSSAMIKIKGQADGFVVSALVREKLSAK
ncbi:MAG: GatB/YqeY domain-containing protein [Candidatus Curtissbacteria bacterium]|nr:GatB/YqeY domain-containing protein [Candidatus Curtissbacteria bacterium]